MARPLPTPESHRVGTNGTYQSAPHYQDLLGGGANQLTTNGVAGGVDEAPDLESLRLENAQLKALCADLEQALQEASQHDRAWEERVREYEALLDQKSEMISQLHQELQETRAALEETQPGGAAHAGAMPHEQELLALSEELERERRQLQEDEQTLMEQMRQMEMGMARERADLARQRNELQRLRGEIAHELERLERSGALQNKIESLKSKLQDASIRRGAAPSSSGAPGSGVTPALPASTPPAAPAAPAKKEGLMGRLFG